MSKIPYDKKLHFGAGFAIAMMIGIFNSLYGLIAGLIAGIGKEIYDYHDYGKFDPYDMLATFLGSFVGYGVMLLIHKL